MGEGGKRQTREKEYDEPRSTTRHVQKELRYATKAQDSSSTYGPAGWYVRTYVRNKVDEGTQQMLESKVFSSVKRREMHLASSHGLKGLNPDDGHTARKNGRSAHTSMSIGYTKGSTNTWHR